MDRELVQEAFDDANSWITGALVVGVLDLADRTGVLRLLGAGGQKSADDVSRQCGIDQRYALELLSTLAAAGVVTHNDGFFEITRERFAVFGDERSPYFMGGLIHETPSALATIPRLAEAFVTGDGLERSDYPADSRLGIGRGNGPSIRVLMVRKWLAAMPDVVAALQTGIRVLDVGCGVGAVGNTIAAAFPASTIEGIDIDGDAIVSANAEAADSAASNASFHVADLLDTRAHDRYDLIVAFDVIHDMGMAREGLRAIKRLLAPGGTFLMIEPAAGATLDDNVGERGAFLYGISTLLCLPLSRASGDDALGTAWGPRLAEELAAEAGFVRFERLTIENPANAFYRLG